MIERKRYSEPAWKIVLETLKKENRALSAREIAKISGVNYNTVRGRLQELKRKGLVKNVKGKWIVSK